MSEDAELQRKIAELSGLIQRGKQETTTGPARHTTAHATRWSPYPTRGHARGGYKPTTFRNRTLVNASVAEPSEGGPTQAAASKSAGVTTHDRGRMQWTSSYVYDKKAQEKLQAITETAQAKRQARDAAQKEQVVHHVYGHTASSATTSQTATPREIIVNDLRFRVATDGSKLIRIFGKDHASRTHGLDLNLADGVNTEPHSTPKETKVAGVKFVRTKHGNMIRQGLLKKRCDIVTNYMSRSSLLLFKSRTATPASQKKPCADFTSTGIVLIPRLTDWDYKLSARQHPRVVHKGQYTNTHPGSCARGNRCKFAHDINKLAICKDYLRAGTCAAGEDCNLSHDLLPSRVPTCLHFLRNACTKPDCRYSHVAVDPSAPVCRDFARLGFCEKAAECPERHVSECPDYTNTGVCRNRKCRLPHIDRAGTLRKAAAAKQDGDVAFDVSSDEEGFDAIDSDDADSDEDVIVPAADGGRELSQQDDFVAFGS